MSENAVDGGRIGGDMAGSELDGKLAEDEFQEAATRQRGIRRGKGVSKRGGRGRETTGHLTSVVLDEEQITRVVSSALRSLGISHSKLATPQDTSLR